MKKSKGGIFAAIVFIVLLFGGAVFFSIMSSRDYPDYTVFSSGEKGASLLYDSLSIYGVNVETGYEMIDRYTDSDEVHILIEPSFKGFQVDEEVIDFVESGGKLILAADVKRTAYLNGFLKNGASELQKNDYFVTLSMGDGFVLIVDSEKIINEQLKIDRSTGSEIAKMLRLWSYDKAVFNEHYHGYSSESQSMWLDLPFAYKLFVVQLGIVGVFLVLSKGKRFGKPTPLYEEVERTENEYIKAMANLFQRSRQYDAAAESYYRQFLEKASTYFKTDFDYTKDNILSLWQERELLHADLLLETMNRYSSGFNKPQLKAFVSEINELLKCLH